MATVTFKNARQLVGTSYSTIYSPTGLTAIVAGLTIANVNGSNAADISCQWLDSSNSNAATRVAHTINVNPDSSISILVEPIALEAGDALQLVASAANYLEATATIAEITA